MTPHDLISRPGGYRLSKGVTATREALEGACDHIDQIAAISPQWATAYKYRATIAKIKAREARDE